VPLENSRDAADPSINGISPIYQDANAQPRSDGQVSALQLAHNQSSNVPWIVALPASSGKLALIFSVAAMATQQTVIVVVCGIGGRHGRTMPGGRIAMRGMAGRAVTAVDRRQCRPRRTRSVFALCQRVGIEWAVSTRVFRRMPRSIHRHVVPRAIAGIVDVAVFRMPIYGIDSHIDGAIRRRIARAVVHRQCRDISQEQRATDDLISRHENEAPSAVATQFVQQFPLASPKRGIVYVRIYTTGPIVGEALGCPFYNAQAEDEGEVLQEWMRRAAGWVVATRALGTGINIEGIVCIVQVGRPYELTGFAQQFGPGGRNGEVSDSVIIT